MPPLERGSEKEGEGGEPMAALAFEFEQRELSEALGSIGELKNVIAHSVLEQRGFTNVVNNPAEVAGNRNGCRLSVLHLHISGRNFFRVVVCACDSFDKARATVDEVEREINNLHFL
jgi:hypothetical protein